VELGEVSWPPSRAVAGAHSQKTQSEQEASKVTDQRDQGGQGDPASTSRKQVGEPASPRPLPDAEQTITPTNGRSSSRRGTDREHQQQEIAILVRCLAKAASPMPEVRWYGKVINRQQPRPAPR